MSLPSSAIAPVPDLGILHCSGADALDFLHRQLTQDFALLRHDSARLAGFLSAKGRMQASFIAVRYGATDVLLLTHASVLESVRKRLSMFVLRAKVTVRDASAQWQVLGLLGDAVAAQAAAPLAPWQVQASPAAINGPAAAEASLPASETSWTIGLYPAEGTARALHLCAASNPQAPQTDTAAEAWAWSEVMAGIATVSAPVAEQFVPQMLNYESVGGVNFKKGCYPGQEVVARSQFRGAIKRRAYLAHGEGAALPAPGTELLPASDATQPCGMVVQSAWRWDHGSAAGPAFDAIVSIRTDSADAPLYYALADGAADMASTADAPTANTAPLTLQIRPMPYPILEDI